MKYKTNVKHMDINSEKMKHVGPQSNPELDMLTFFEICEFNRSKSCWMVATEHDSKEFH